MKRLILILLILSISGLVAAPNPDSSFAKWINTSNTPQARSDAFSNYLNVILNTKPNDAIIMADELIKFSNENNLKSGLAHAYEVKGKSNFLIGNLKESLKNLEKSLKFYEELKDKRGILSTSTNISVVYDNLGNYPKALHYNEVSVALAKELGAKVDIMNCYNNMGVIYDNLGDNLKALEYYNKCLDLSNEMGNLAGISSSQMNIALLHVDEKNHKEAVTYIDKSLDNAKKSGDILRISNAYNNIGYVYSKVKRFDEALKYYNEGLRQYVKLNEKKGVANSLYCIGELKMDMNKHADAIWYFDESLSLFKEIAHNYDLANNYEKRGRSYFVLGDNAKAIADCKLALQISEKIGTPEVSKEASECLANIYEKTGDKKNFEKYKAKLAEYNEILKSEETSKQIMMVEVRKQLVADSIAAVALLKHDNIISKESEENIRARDVAIGSGTVVFIIVGSMIARKKRTKKAKVSETV